jgi:DNA primase large subunit
MKSTQPRFLNEGWLIVDDEEAIEQLGLTTMYGNIFEIDNMSDFFAKDESEIQRILSNMPRGFKNSIATFAREHIEAGKLDSNRKIKLLEQLLDVDLKIFE